MIPESNRNPVTFAPAPTLGFVSSGFCAVHFNRCFGRWRSHFFDLFWFLFSRKKIFLILFRVARERTVAVFRLCCQICNWIVRLGMTLVLYFLFFGQECAICNPRNITSLPLYLIYTSFLILSPSRTYHTWANWGSDFASKVSEQVFSFGFLFHTR